MLYHVIQIITTIRIKIAASFMQICMYVFMVACVNVYYIIFRYIGYVVKVSYGVYRIWACCKSSKLTNFVKKNSKF